jgi:hypothetical protein
MKKYKVVKEMPFFEVGEIIEIEKIIEEGIVKFRFSKNNFDKCFEEVKETKEETKSWERLPEDSVYFYKDSDGDVWSTIDNRSHVHDYHWEHDNYSKAKTREEAGKEFELKDKKLAIKTQLERLADRLNNGEVIDWGNDDQIKYYILYYYWAKRFEITAVTIARIESVTFCLDANFLDIAKKEIGEDNLILLFK